VDLDLPEGPEPLAAGPASSCSLSASTWPCSGLPASTSRLRGCATWLVRPWQRLAEVSSGGLRPRNTPNCIIPVAKAQCISRRVAASRAGPAPAHRGPEAERGQRPPNALRGSSRSRRAVVAGAPVALSPPARPCPGGLCSQVGGGSQGMLANSGSAHCTEQLAHHPAVRARSRAPSAGSRRFRSATASSPPGLEHPQQFVGIALLVGHVRGTASTAPDRVEAGICQLKGQGVHHRKAAGARPAGVRARARSIWPGLMPDAQHLEAVVAGQDPGAAADPAAHIQHAWLPAGS
jgi:hypothetical protein